MSQQILKKAVRLFAQNSFEGTSAQALADAVGIRTSSLFYHFKTKEKILDAAIDDIFNQLKNEIPSFINTSQASDDRFSCLLELAINYFAEDRNRAILVVREFITHPEKVAKHIRYHLGPWIQIITDYISMGKQSGAVRPDINPEQYVFQVLMVITGTLTLADTTATIFDHKKEIPSADTTDVIIQVVRERLFTTS